MANIPVIIELRGDGTQLRGTLRSGARDLQQFGGQVENVERRANSAGRAATAMGRAVGAAIAGLGVRAIIRASDEFANLSTQIGLVSDSNSEFVATQSEVSRIARATRSDLTAVGTLYARLDSSLESLNTTQAEVSQLTETITQSFVISGASAAESAGSIRQISQAFASGVLRGDEFNSVNEQAPRIMQALADQLGVTRGELRGMAEQGELTSDILRNALLASAGQINEEFGRVNVTFSQAGVVLRNTIVELIGVTSQATALGTQGGNAILGFADIFGNAAAFVRDNALEIRLGVIAVQRTFGLVFAEASGAVQLFAQITAATVQNTLNVFQNLRAGVLEELAGLVSAIANNPLSGLPGFSDLSEDLQGTAAGLRDAAAEARLQ